MNRAKSGALFLCLILLVTTGCTLPLEGQMGSAGEGGEGGKSGQGGQGGTGGAQTSSVTTGGVVDTTAPTFVSSIPANNAAKVAVGAPISVTFSEALAPSTITDVTFTVTTKGAPVPGKVTSAGATATFTPTTSLVLDGSFVATMSTAVTDLAGNALATDHTWVFTTPVRPTVVSTNPADAAQGVPINRRVEATFSVPMAPASITAATFFVKEGATPVVGAVTYLGTTATFVPSGYYSKSTTLTATLTTGAKDTAGNGLAKDHVWSFQTGTKATQPPVVLGLAAPFGVLASVSVVNTDSPGTLITGDLGVSPGTSVVGFPQGKLTGGKYVGAAADGAQIDLLAAYNDASGRLSAAALPADLQSLTFTPGLYRQPNAVTVSTGNCTLDAEGDPDGIFIFQVGTAFHMAADTKILLVGGAKANNVYWTVGAAVTLGATATFEGTILGAADITLGKSTSMVGRLLTHAGTVTLDTNLVTVPDP